MVFQNDVTDQHPKEGPGNITGWFQKMSLSIAFSDVYHVSRLDGFEPASRTWITVNSSEIHTSSAVTYQLP